ncbi:MULTISPECIES: hypothetical protein [unclassified Nonomuraea]|uniref:hypothetical protein n=1 Tax=unclassified Nonomuraea TaxID=2593643 RepID=UPI0033CF6E48
MNAALSLLGRAERITRSCRQAVVCRQTAAHVWGLSVLSVPDADWPVEVIAPAHLAIPGCVTYVGEPPADDVTDHRGVRLTTMARTALDCARSLPRPEAVAALDQFARRGVDMEALWRRPLNSWRLRDTLSLADGGAASPRESWLRVVLVDGGLPRPATQLAVPLAAAGAPTSTWGGSRTRWGSSTTARSTTPRRRTGGATPSAARSCGGWAGA